MDKFRFRNFRAYQDAIGFRMTIKSMVAEYFPRDERYHLSDQILRAVNSIVLNIAEVADRGTYKDFALFLNRAHTSLNEVVACLDIALKENYITTKFYDNLVEEAEALANQITAFRRKLLISPTK